MLAANAVTAEKISAGAITADKLSVNSLSAVSATIGTLRTATSGARTEISDNLICVLIPFVGVNCYRLYCVVV